MNFLNTKIFPTVNHSIPSSTNLYRREQLLAKQVQRPAFWSMGFGILILTWLSWNQAPDAPSDVIRMCTTIAEQEVCPVDNPIFPKSNAGIFISIESGSLKADDKVRFSWYAVQPDIYIADFLGTTYSQVSRNAELGFTSSRFPQDVEIKSGDYEVVINLPGEVRPIVKTFKVID